MFYLFLFDLDCEISLEVFRLLDFDMNILVDQNWMRTVKKC